MSNTEHKDTFAAIVLAAGSGSRMHSAVKKQFMDLNGKPLIYYALHAFSESPVDEIILVTGEDEVEYCEKEIVDLYGFKKVRQIVAGGKERYESVYHGLLAVTSDYVLIHDGARAFIDQEVILRAMESVKKYKACVAGMPSKDTMKIVDENQMVTDTPLRARIWQVQTPQCFVTEEILKAYTDMMASKATGITDDAMVMEQFGGRRIKLIEGSYKNIKVTTPEDLLIGEAFLKHE